jgi:phthalate 4,5-cis-dihydrodiol dehydrogenase
MTLGGPGRLRFGVIGLGMAGALMVPRLANHAGTILAGACDLDPGLRARFQRDHGVDTFDDVRALVSRPDIDAVYVATPHQFHREHAVLAAEHRKHIIVEKPMGLSLLDCDAMIEAAERNGVVLVVGHTHSFDPAIARIHDIIQSGDFGALAMIAMWNYTDFIYRPRRPEELDTALGGGIHFNQIPHQVDIARLLSGSPLRSVRAMSAVLDPERGTEGCCAAFIDFDSGVGATLTYSGYDHFDSDELHQWVGSTGRKKQPRHGATRKALAALGGRDEELRQRIERYGYGGNVAFMEGTAEHQPHFGLLVATLERADVRTSADGVIVYSERGAEETKISGSTDGRSRVLDEFCAAVVGGIPPVHDGRFARATVQACLAILESSRARREIFIS